MPEERSVEYLFPQLVQGSESSTGTVHPAREIAELVAKRDNTLMCVDAITWIGAHEVQTDPNRLLYL